MTLLYYLALGTYTFIIRIAAFLGHSKAKKWVQGRYHWQQNLLKWRQQHPEPLLWMHCASLGEFEQGRPLLEALRTRYPDHRLVLSFFSPSGYERLHQTPLADHVLYLPSDTWGTGAYFLQILRPSAAFFIKYEFWHGYLHTLEQRGIPTYLVGAAFRQKQPFFRWYGGFFRRMLGCFTQIFVQNQRSLALLQAIGYQQATLVGDPRLDRVLAIRATAPDYPQVAAFAQKRPVLVAGSTWPPDEALLAQLLADLPQLRLVIAPHEITPAHLQAIEQQFEPYRTLRYTLLEEATDQPIQARVLIVDTIGMLKAIYRYGDLAYIGGAFGAGLHNSLEAAVYGKPLLFGPRHQKFQEAQDFIQLGAATNVQDALTLRQATQAALAPEHQQQVQQALQNYFEQHQGATERILQHLPDHFSLT